MEISLCIYVVFYVFFVFHISVKNLCMFFLFCICVVYVFCMCKMSVLQTVVMQVEDEVGDCLAVEQEVDGLHAVHMFACVCVC